MIDFEEFKFNELLDKKISVVLNKRFKIFTFILSDTLKKTKLEVYVDKRLPAWCCFHFLLTHYGSELIKID